MQRFSSQASTLVAIAVLGFCAFLGSAMFVGRPSRTVVPFIFAALAIAVSARFGAAAGIGGTLLGAAVFAYFLFSPIGRIKVEDTAARAELGWMLLAGVSLSYLLASPGVSDHNKRLK